jgi:TPR repeat protein
LGVGYYNGEGIMQDKKEAYFWLFLSAENGSEDAKQILGMFSIALNVFQRMRIESRARKWLEEHHR